MTVTGLLAVPIGALLAVGAAASGFRVAQLAYREGGLGPPLATLILVDPLVGGISGRSCGGNLAVSVGQVTFGMLGLIVIASGLGP